MTPGTFVKNKVLLITGAGGGVGRDFALALARDGSKVVINDVDTSTEGEGSDPARARGMFEWDPV